MPKGMTHKASEFFLKLTKSLDIRPRIYFHSSHLKFLHGDSHA